MTNDHTETTGHALPSALRADETSVTRRQVLSGLAVGATFGMSGLTSVFGDEPKKPAEKIRIGVIGFGRRCAYLMNSMLALPDVRCLAVADVQKTRREAGKTLVDQLSGNTDCVTYRDMRELIARKDIDAVVVATGDRWHTPAAIMVAEAGKAVYCEKPCGLSIKNVQDLAAAIKRTGVVFQAGTQRRSMPQFQRAVELARSGKLGKLDTLYASVYAPELGNTWLPAQPTPAADVCDWNLWLGPAPWRPYNADYVAGQWRNQYDFESGARLIDWGAHTVDLCQWANDADTTAPTEFVPGKTDITCRYANGVKLVLAFLKNPFAQRGPVFNDKVGVCPVRFVGSEGSVQAGDAGIEVTLGTAEPKFEDTKMERFLDSRGHARNFFDCVRSKKTTIAHPGVMLQSHITSFAASLSWILGRTLKFDPVKNEFLGDAEANSLRSRLERNCWA